MSLTLPQVPPDVPFFLILLGGPDLCVAFCSNTSVLSMSWEAEVGCGQKADELFGPLFPVFPSPVASPPALALGPLLSFSVSFLPSLLPPWLLLLGTELRLESLFFFPDRGHLL